MLQARSEQPGDTPSTDAGATLQQPQTNLQPTGTTNGNSTSTPQTTSTVPQQQLQAPNLRVGDTQTLIANSTVAQAAPAAQNPATVWLWVILPIVLFVVVVWRISKMTAANPSGATGSAEAFVPTPSNAARTEASVPASAATPKLAVPAKKAKKPAKGTRRQRKQKR